jgi:hypothetical protein
MASKLRREYSRSLVLHAKLYPKNILAEAKIGHICYRVPPTNRGVVRIVTRIHSLLHCAPCGISFTFEPPSSGTLAPIQRALSEAKNATTSSTSSGFECHSSTPESSW